MPISLESQIREPAVARVTEVEVRREFEKNLWQLCEL